MSRQLGSKVSASSDAYDDDALTVLVSYYNSVCIIMCYSQFSVFTNHSSPCGVEQHYQWRPNHRHHHSYGTFYETQTGDKKIGEVIVAYIHYLRRK